MRKGLISFVFVLGVSFSGVLYGQANQVLTMKMEPVETPDHVAELILKKQESKLLREWNAKNNFSLMSFDEIDWEFIENSAKKIWEVIVAGQPVLNESHNYANALPKGITESDELDGFSDYQFQSWRVSGTNWYGVEVYHFVYTIAHRFGGHYEGKGAYLTDVTVLPSDINVLWGYTLDVGVQNIKVTNVGNKEVPVASLSLEMEMKVSTVVQKRVTRRLIEFRGDRSDARIIR